MPDEAAKTPPAVPEVPSPPPPVVEAAKASPTPKVEVVPDTPVTEYKTAAEEQRERSDQYLKDKAAYHAQLKRAAEQAEAELAK